MGGASKSSKAKELEDVNLQNDDCSSSEETLDCDSDTGRNKRLSTDNDDSAKQNDRHRAIARLDPFHCNKVKLAALHEKLEKMSSSAKKKFLMEPVPKDVWFQCCILRISTGVTKLNRMFRMYVDRGEIVERRDILASCVKRKNNATSNYCVTTDLESTSNDSEYFVGKIRSNFIGSQFKAYDAGENPTKLWKNKAKHRGLPSDRVRCELAAITYDNPFIQKKKTGPRQMTVVIPHVEDTPYGPVVASCRPLAPSRDGLIALTTHRAQNSASDGKPPLVRTYINKPAKWSKNMNSYVLNFNDRVSVASVKNFQLVQTDNAKEIYLQFGRYGENKFHLDFRYPMSPFQALAIAMSSMDYKICSE